jgi:dihydrodipicolinate synthase/N-acetylneuraminate lyase
MIGCTSTYTLGVARRAAYAAEIGADAIQVALPYWMEINEDQIVPFLAEVVSASGGLPLSIYETTRAKRTLTVEQHWAIKDAVPGYMMVKANAGTLGCTPKGCASLSQFVNVFVGEDKWGQLGRTGAIGCCSSVVYWNPYLILALWHQLQQREWASVDATCERISHLFEFIGTTYGPKGFTDTAYDRLGGIAGGFLKASLRSRGPYPACTQEDVETLRRWYHEHFPEMLRME